MANYVGIDPGKTGALALVDQSGSTLEVWDTPTRRPSGGRSKRLYDLEGMVRVFCEALARGPAEVAIEAVHSMPGQGVATMFAMGEGLGIWKGIVAAHRVPWRPVPPKVWHRGLGISPGESGDERKAAAWRFASERFPESAHLLVTPRGRLLDGRSDAACLAEFIRRDATR